MVTMVNLWIVAFLLHVSFFSHQGASEQIKIRNVVGILPSRHKRYDTGLLMSNCRGLRNRCRYVPAGRCVRACINGDIKMVCRVPPTHSADNRCIVLPSTRVK